MKERVISSVEQVSVAWLTSVLIQSGALTHGQVASFTLDAGQGNWSTSAKLAVVYTDDAAGLLPRRLFLKMADTDLGDGEYFDDSEVRYYTRDYVDVRHAPLLRCYSAEYSEALRRYHLLLDDVSETHIAAMGQVPTLEYGLALAEGLGILHARWWGADGLIAAGVSMHSVQHLQQFIAIAAPGSEHILREFSHELKAHWPSVLRDMFSRYPGLISKRMENPNGFTMIHGDAGGGNILAPRQGARPIYIIDRQPFNWSLTIWLGVYDLAYAMVLDWDIETRRRYEIPILERYHETLKNNGVRNYTWEQLYSDYRLCAVMCAYVATEYCRGGINERWVHVWLPMLQRALTAYDDLRVLPRS